MYSTPSRSSASRIMSAPVNLLGGLLFPLKMKKPPPLGRGLLRSVWWFSLGRACPRFNANKAQKAKKYEAEDARLSHLHEMLTSEPSPRVVGKTQISGVLSP